MVGMKVVMTAVEMVDQMGVKRVVNLVVKRVVNLVEMTVAWKVVRMVGNLDES